MIAPFKFEIGRPENGWIESVLTDAEGSVFRMISSPIPWDSIADLAGALASVIKGVPTAQVSWNEEPVEYEFYFTTESTQTTLTITRHPDHRRIAGQGSEVVRLTASSRDMCLPFWRALRQLQSLVSVEEYNEAWRRGFPTGKVEELTRLIRDEA